MHYSKNSQNYICLSPQIKNRLPLSHVITKRSFLKTSNCFNSNSLYLAISEKSYWIQLIQYWSHQTRLMSHCQTIECREDYCMARLVQRNSPANWLMIGMSHSRQNGLLMDLLLSDPSALQLPQPASWSVNENSKYGEHDGESHPQLLSQKWWIIVNFECRRMIVWFHCDFKIVLNFLRSKLSATLWPFDEAKSRCDYGKITGKLRTYFFTKLSTENSPIILTTKHFLGNKVIAVSRKRYYSRKLVQL